MSNPTTSLDDKPLGTSSPAHRPVAVDDKDKDNTTDASDISDDEFADAVGAAGSSDVAHAGLETETETGEGEMGGPSTSPSRSRPSAGTEEAVGGGEGEGEGEEGEEGPKTMDVGPPPLTHNVHSASSLSTITADERDGEHPQHHHAPPHTRSSPDSSLNITTEGDEASTASHQQPSAGSLQSLEPPDPAAGSEDTPKSTKSTSERLSADSSDSDRTAGSPLFEHAHDAELSSSMASSASVEPQSSSPVKPAAAQSDDLARELGGHDLVTAGTTTTATNPTTEGMQALFEGGLFKGVGRHAGSVDLSHRSFGSANTSAEGTTADTSRRDSQPAPEQGAKDASLDEIDLSRISLNDRSNGSRPASLVALPPSPSKRQNISIPEPHPASASTSPMRESESSDPRSSAAASVDTNQRFSAASSSFRHSVAGTNHFSTVSLSSLPPSASVSNGPSPAPDATSFRTSTSKRKTLAALASADQQALRGTSVGSGSSSTGGDYGFLLARLENQNAQLSGDPKAQRSSVDGLDKIKKSFDRLHREAEEEGEGEEEIDWDFWGSVVSNYGEVAQAQPSKLAKSIQNGIPAALRGMLWQLMSSSKDEELELIYAYYLKETSPHEKAIRRDLSRTFPDQTFFQEGKGPGQEELFNVVKAYSLYDSECGYMQGIAFIAGPLLLNMPSEEAFCVLVRLMKSYDLRGHFIPDMPTLQLRLFQFDRLLEDLLPLLYKHLTRKGVKSSMYASQWLMTMFSYRFPLELVYRIFDIVFAEGIEAVLRFGIALMKKNEERLLDLDFDDLVVFLKGNLFDCYKSASSRSSTAASSATSSHASDEATPAYRAGAFVRDAYAVRITPFVLDQYATEFDEACRARNAHVRELEGLRLVNRALAEKVKELETSLAQLNTEHCDLVKSLVMAKLEKEEIEEQLVKYKLMYAELFLSSPSG